MEAFERGEEVQVDKGYYGCWALTKEPSWNWPENNYRIKSKTKQVVVLETWLISSDSLGMFILKELKTSNYIRLPQQGLLTCQNSRLLLVVITASLDSFNKYEKTQALRQQAQRSL